MTATDFFHNCWWQVLADHSRFDVLIAMDMTCKKLRLTGWMHMVDPTGENKLLDNSRQTLSTRQVIHLVCSQRGLSSWLVTIYIAWNQRWRFLTLVIMNSHCLESGPTRHIGCGLNIQFFIGLLLAFHLEIAEFRWPTPDVGVNVHTVHKLLFAAGRVGVTRGGEFRRAEDGLGSWGTVHCGDLHPIMVEVQVSHQVMVDAESRWAYRALQVVPAPLFVALPVVVTVELLPTQTAGDVLDFDVAVHVGLKVDALVKRLAAHRADEVHVTFVHLFMVVPLLTDHWSIGINCDRHDIKLIFNNKKQQVMWWNLRNKQVGRAK